MQFNLSLNKQKSILAFKQTKKKKKVEELSLSVTRMSRDGVCVQEGGLEKKEKNFLLRTISTKVSHLVSFGFLSGLLCISSILERLSANRLSAPFLSTICKSNS